MWHTQWMIMVAPFMVLSTFVMEEYKIQFVLDVILGALVFIYSAIHFPGYVDQGLLEHGLLRHWIDFSGMNMSLTVSELIPMDISLVSTAITGILIVAAIYKSPKYAQKQMNIIAEHVNSLLGYRVLVGFCTCIVPIMICFGVYLYNYQIPVYGNTDGRTAFDLTQGQSVQQSVSLDNSIIITSMKIQVATYARKNTGELEFSLIDEKGNIIYQENKDNSEMTDWKWVSVQLPNVEFKADENYTIRIRADENADAGNNVAVIGNPSGAIGDENILNIVLCTKGKRL